jgi:hypothetical protein
MGSYGISSPYEQNVHNVPKIIQLQISSPVADLQWKVLVHAARNKVPL